MPVTTRHQDKFAFLFTGPTDARYQKDLENVYITLTEYYGYPASNIWVVCGGPDDLSASFPLANYSSVYTAADPKQSFIDLYTAFATAVEGNTPDTSITDSRNVALIYFTGKGINGSPPFVMSKLVIRPAGTYSEVTIDSRDTVSPFGLKEMIAGVPFLKSHVNLVMQQDFADTFTLDLYSNGINSTDKTVTNVNGSQTTYGDDINGGNFTKGWISALQQTDKVLVSLVPKYADELPYTSELYHISLEQAKEFAQIKNSPQIYNFGSSGETAFLGKPAFLVRDGDNTVGWWESPDIYLTHPMDTLHPGKQDDLYIPDIPDPLGLYNGPWNNTINIVFRNIGTHPVRCYNLGIQIFRTPFGTTPPSPPTLTLTGQDTGTVLKPTVLLPNGSFSNTNKLVYSWNTQFYTGVTHECIRAKVQLPTIPISFTWDVLSNDAEAQRNTDLSSDPPKKGSRQIPGDNFRGNKKHLYSIHNPFKETHEFKLTALPEYTESLKSVVMKWFVEVEGNKWKKLDMADCKNKFKELSFVLKGGEKVDLIGEFGFKKWTKGKIRLPIEILIDKRSGSDSRTPLAPSLRDKFSAISGFTIIMTYEPADLICKVVDKKGNADPAAKVHIQTINGLAAENIPVDKNGEIKLKSVNPDVYRIKAVSKSGESIDQIVQLSGRETAKIKLEIISPAKKPVKKKR